ncbi:MAG: hypothetical protein U0Q21_13385 [Dermatophilaceae bacterium]
MKKLSLAAALAAASLALAGCGGDSKTATSSSTTSSAASTSASTSVTTSTSASTTSSPESSTSTSDSGATASSLADAQVGDTIDGAVLAAAMKDAFKDGTTGHMSMDMGGMITAEGDFKVADGKQDSTMSMEMSGTKMEMISVGGVIYMKSPLFAGGTKWVKMDATTAGASGTPDLNSFDPATMAKAFSGMKAKVTAKTADATTVQMDLDLKKLVEAMGDNSAIASATASLPESIPVTYTIDKDGRPTATTMNMGMDIKVAYSDWGKSVSIEAPPSSQVTTM